MNTQSQTKQIQFTCQGSVLQGMLHLPAAHSSTRSFTHSCSLLPPLPPLVIGSHGLGGSMESAKQQLLSRLLPENGIAFLRFDHRGCGISEGDFATDTSLSKRAADMLHAIEHVQQMNLTDKRIFLFGSSLGGSTCISTWSKLVENGMPPCGAILCAAPVNTLTISQLPLAGNDRRPSLPISFFKNNLLFDLTDELSALHHLLIFHGDRDQTVPVENAYTLYSNAGEPKELVIFKGGDHQMSNKADQKKFEKKALTLLKNICFQGTGSK